VLTILDFPWVLLGDVWEKFRLRLRPLDLPHVRQS
jgi:hypothetical protein